MQTIIQGFAPKKVLGVGTYSKVYRIYALKNGVSSSFALKIITAACLPRQERQRLMERCQTESEILRELSDCKNIVRPKKYTVCPDKGMAYIVMDELQALSETRLDHNSVLEMSLDICNALNECEKRGIVHCDIKPQNIFVSDSGIYLLGDFGSAFRINNRPRDMVSSGTLEYMAPEIYMGLETDNSADVYSLALILYEHFNGELPFLSASDRSREAVHSSLIRRLSGEPVPPPSGCPKELGKVICKALAPEADDRYESAAEFTDELKRSVKCLLQNKSTKAV